MLSIKVADRKAAKKGIHAPSEESKSLFKHHVSLRRVLTCHHFSIISLGIGWFVVLISTGTLLLVADCHGKGGLRVAPGQLKPCVVVHVAIMIPALARYCDPS